MWEGLEGGKGKGKILNYPLKLREKVVRQMLFLLPMDCNYHMSGLILTLGLTDARLGVV